MTSCEKLHVMKISHKTLQIECFKGIICHDVKESLQCLRIYCAQWPFRYVRKNFQIQISPMLFKRKIQKVSVTEDNRVAMTMILEDKTPSLPMFLAMM